jgi:8-oxo-dGTP pyrophosphatase MutT (NUDIX family)
MGKTQKIKRDFSCGGLVWDPNEEKILLVQVENLQKKKVWTFPKGHPEKKESDTEAALREVLEETGWECKIVRPLIDVDYFYVHEGTRTHKTVRWFLMEPVKKTGKFAEGEILDCAWVSPTEAKVRITYDSDKKLLSTLGY